MEKEIRYFVSGWSFRLGFTSVPGYAADHIGYEWTGRAHGSLADALATLAVQRWLEQWLVAE